MLVSNRNLKPNTIPIKTVTAETRILLPQSTHRPQRFASLSQSCARPGSHTFHLWMLQEITTNQDKNPLQKPPVRSIPYPPPRMHTSFEPGLPAAICGYSTPQPCMLDE